jgi:dTDP-4-amino-4,6-dideoxygalactose transaminase
MALGIGLGCGPDGSPATPPRLSSHDPANPSTVSPIDDQDEVVTTAYSFFATPETAARLGARPIFADIEEDGFNADPQELLSKVSPRTRAILPVHLFGQRLDVKPLVESGVPVIEDAAQTLVPGIGQTAKCATLSFFPSKNLGAAGDAGAIVTSDALLYDALTAIRQHGSRPKYVHALWGGNFRMDPIQAAILRVKLHHLPSWQAQRRKNAARYHAILSTDALLSSLPLRLPPHPETAPEHAFHHFVIRVPEKSRAALRTYLTDRGIETEVYYPMALHLQPCFTHLGYRPGSLPRAEAAAKESLALPVHPDLSDDQIDFVSESIRAFYRS